MTLKTETLQGLISNFDSEHTGTLKEIATLDARRAALESNAKQLRQVITTLGGMIPSGEE